MSANASTSTTYKQAMLTPMSAELQNAVHQLYRLFGRYKAPAGMLDVCTGCCMDAKLEREMRTLPLRSLTVRHFYEYGDSAKSEVQPAEELLYLLPRMLELMAEGHELRHSLEIALDRLGNCPRDAFSDAQWKAIESYALALFAQVLSRYPWELKGLQNSFDYLLMFDIGGIDIQPMLALWLNTNTPQATLQYVNSSFFEFWYYGGVIDNAFAIGRRTEYIEAMGTWMHDPENRRIFALRILNIKLEDQPGHEQWWCGCNRTCYDVIDAVFDAVTYHLSTSTH